MNTTRSSVLDCKVIFGAIFSGSDIGGLIPEKSDRVGQHPYIEQVHQIFMLPVTTVYNFGVIGDLANDNFKGNGHEVGSRNALGYPMYSCIECTWN